MALLDIQVTLRTSSGIPNDYLTNLWHFDDGEAAEYEEICDEIETFYNGVRPVLSAYVIQNGHEIKVYRVSDPEPRAPVYQTTFNFSSAPAGNTLPTEVASVLSYQAAQVSGIPQARRRGRIYIGTLNTSQIGTDGRLTSTHMGWLEAAAETLLTASNSSTTWKWATHSKVLGSGASVYNGWVDNEPDTQRRRGREATSRLAWGPT